MQTIRRNRHIHSCAAVIALFIMSACGGGGDGAGNEQQTSSSPTTLELANWAQWDVTGIDIASQYDPETKMATLTHDGPETEIAYSQHTISLVGQYGIQLSSSDGVERAQLIPLDASQHRIRFVAPEQDWVDLNAAFPTNVEFAPGTEFVQIRVMIGAGASTVGTVSLNPIGQVALPTPVTEPQPEPDTSPPTF